MKKGTYRWGIVSLVLVAAGIAWMQTPDFAGKYDAKVALIKVAHANAADSGIRVDRAGYQEVGVVVDVGQSDITSAVGTGDYLILLDSTPGTAAWQLQDSVPMDSTDNKGYTLSYRGTKRWVRVMARASGSAADTVGVVATFLLGAKRARP